MQGTNHGIKYDINRQIHNPTTFRWEVVMQPGCTQMHWQQHIRQTANSDEQSVTQFGATFRLQWQRRCEISETAGHVAGRPACLERRVLVMLQHPVSQSLGRSVDQCPPPDWRTDYSHAGDTHTHTRSPSHSPLSMLSCWPFALDDCCALPILTTTRWRLAHDVQSLLRCSAPQAATLLRHDTTRLDTKRVCCSATAACAASHAAIHVAAATTRVPARRARQIFTSTA